jgi:integrase
MSNKAKSWYYGQVGAYYAWIGGKKTKLLKAKESEANTRRAQKILKSRLQEREFQVRFNVQPERSDQTVASVLEAYQENAKASLGSGTRRIRFAYQQSFAEAHGWRKVNECKPSHMRSWLDSHTEWESDWTKNRALRDVQVAFNWAAGEESLIAKNPFKSVHHPTGDPRRDMTRDEFQTFLRASQGIRPRYPWRKVTPGARFRQVLIMLWYTGMRPSEVAHLKWADVDFRTGKIVLKQHKTRKTQKTPKPREVYLHPVVVKLLHSIQGREEGGEYVFLNRRFNPWLKDTLCQRVHRARKLAGLPDDVKLYGVRHSFGTRGILNNVPLKVLSQLMGHTSTRTTEGYLHLTGKDQHLAAATLSLGGLR